MRVAAIRAAIELSLAAAAALGSAIAWSQVGSTVLVGPVADGEPVTTSVSYDAPQLLLTLLLAALAGVLGVVGAARVRRTLRCGKAPAVTTDMFAKIP